MLVETALSLLFGSVGILAVAVLCGVLARRAWRSSARTRAQMAAKDQPDEPQVRHNSARGLRRTTRGPRLTDPADQERFLRDIASVMRGNESDPAIVGAARRYMAEKRIILPERAPEPDPVAAPEKVVPPRDLGSKVA